MTIWSGINKTLRMLDLVEPRKFLISSGFFHAMGKSGSFIKRGTVLVLSGMHTMAVRHLALLFRVSS